MTKFIFLLIFMTIFINGATDACGSIASAVSCGAVSYKRAALIAAFMNFAGGAVSCIYFHSVRDEVVLLADFPAEYAVQAVCIVMVTVIVWASCAWLLGLPTSESHALLAASTGAAFALRGHMPESIRDVLCGLLFSIIFSGAAGYAAARIIGYVHKHRPMKAGHGDVPFAKTQTAALAVSAFLHGSQDTQKLSALLLAAAPVIHTQNSNSLYVMLLCSVVMGVGTLCGGRKSTNRLGSEMTALTPVGAVSSDAANALSLMILTLGGFPVSTTHTKAVAMLACAASGEGVPECRIAAQLASAWVLTFPVCGLAAYAAASLFLL